MEQRTVNTDPAKMFLQSVFEARSEAQRLRRKITRLEAQTEHITANLTGMPHSGNRDSEGAWAALADIRASYAQKLLDAELVEKGVADFIDTLPTRECRVVLRLRYLDCLRWPSVMSGLEKAGICYEERQVYRIHGKALSEAREMWAEWRAAHV